MTSKTPGSWQWPEDMGAAPAEPERTHKHNGDTEPAEHQHQDDQQEKQKRFYRPRTCRICFETVNPTYHPPSESLPAFLQPSSPRVTYESEDGGRLLRPCLCKGSQKYVHEGCLNSWRLHDPLTKRNYWQCPTCRYQYRLERMAWGRWIGSTTAQIILTLLIFVVAAFALGFLADPIINLYLDPFGTVASGPAGVTQPIYDDEPDTWVFHFTKGLASLGLLGFAKFLLSNPLRWWNMRISGTTGGRRAGTTGRDRLEQISWITVVIGIATVLWALWRGVRTWSRRTLENISGKVVDATGHDNDDDDDFN